MRPMLFGYLHPPVALPGSELAALSWALTSFAETEGFTLAGIFVETAGSGDGAFTALLATMQRWDARAVAVPSLSHLARVRGLPPAEDRLDHIGALVLVVRVNREG